MFSKAYTPGQFTKLGFYSLDADLNAPPPAELNPKNIAAAAEGNWKNAVAYSAPAAMDFFKNNFAKKTRKRKNTKTASFEESIVALSPQAMSGRTVKKEKKKSLLLPTVLGGAASGGLLAGGLLASGIPKNKMEFLAKTIGIGGLSSAAMYGLGNLTAGDD